MSNIIKKSIQKDEEIKKYFSLCSRYIKIQIIAQLIKWLAIFLAISFILYFIDQTQIFTISKTQNILENRSEEFDEKASQFGFEQNSFNFSNLDNNEISSWILNVWIILTLFFIFIIIPIIIFFNLFYLKISNEFVLTSKRLIVKRGWIETKLKTIYYNRITDISIEQSLIDRIIKSGTLSVSTAGSDGYEAQLIHIRNPYKIKTILYEAKNLYQQKMFSQHQNIQENQDE